MIKPKLLAILASVLSGLGICLFLNAPVYAATFTVDSSADDSDSAAGDGSCDNGSGDCTLRAAIEEANALAGADTIEFSIPGAGVHTIAPGSILPTITTEVDIDGSTQSGASCGTLVPATLPGTNTPHTLMIELDFSGVGLGNGLKFNTNSANNSSVKGIAYKDKDILLDDVDDMTIECNYVGNNAAGDSPSTVTTNGITLESPENTVIQNNLFNGTSSASIVINDSFNTTLQGNLFGTTPDGTATIGSNSLGFGMFNSSSAEVTHNVFVGHSNVAINISSSSYATIKGNYVGLGIDGNVLGNDNDAIVIFASQQNEIGGTDLEDRNVISGNGGDGIHIYSNCNAGSTTNDNRVFNNLIGTNVDGEITNNYGNNVGIEVNEYYGGCVSVYRNQIGGPDDGQPNIIAGNDQQGVLAHQDATHDVFSTSIIANKIFGNGEFGIDLVTDASDEGTPTDDFGPNPINDYTITYPTARANNYLNHPVISEAISDSDSITVTYDFNAPDVEDSGDGYSLLQSNLVGFRLDFYLNDEATDGAYNNYAQGQTHLGSFIVDGSESGATHKFDLPDAFDPNQKVNATATVLWQDIPDDDCDVGNQFGFGPPYQLTDGCGG